MSTLDRKKARSLIIQAIRDFFHQQSFIETDTPSFVLSPGMETHIRPYRVAGTDAFLPTSPEFAMKKILAQGYENIFQICKSYRAEPKSSTHNPEFTMLEWYRAKAGYEHIMDDVENLFTAISERLPETQKFSRPWPRLTIAECFDRFAGVNLEHALRNPSLLAEACVKNGWATKEVLSAEVLDAPGAFDDFFFRVMMNGVEPALEMLGSPVIVYLYPESQAALANLTTDENGVRWAKRFEVYAAGFELGNAFDELVDPVEQRKRFEKDMALRKALYGDEFPPNPIDEEFLEALKTMPPSAGIAMGVDRIVMYFTGATDIKDVLWGESFQ